MLTDSHFIRSLRERAIPRCLQIADRACLAELPAACASSASSFVGEEGLRVSCPAQYPQRTLVPWVAQTAAKIARHGKQ